jgi:hypothetical protein
VLEILEFVIGIVDIENVIIARVKGSVEEVLD